MIEILVLSSFFLAILMIAVIVIAFKLKQDVNIANKIHKEDIGQLRSEVHELKVTIVRDIKEIITEVKQIV